MSCAWESHLWPRPAVDDESSATADKQDPPESNTIIPVTPMHRGFVFSFTDPANDPFAVPASDHSATGLVPAIGKPIAAAVPGRGTIRRRRPKPAALDGTESRVAGRDATSERLPNVHNMTAASRSRQPPKPRKWRTARVAFGAALLVGVLIHGLWSSGSVPVRGAPSSEFVAASIPLRPIEDIRVGDRVITDLPSRMSSETTVDPETWRLVVLRGDVRDDDGAHVGFVDVETLRPPEWIAAERADDGARVHFPRDLIELGLSEELAATVMEIRPCRQVQPGPGRVVQTTVSSPSNSVMELSLRDGDGRTQSIRPTAGHKFFSEDRDDWLPSNELRIGEQLRGLTGAVNLLHAGSLR